MIRLSAIVCIAFCEMFLTQGKLLAADLSKKPDSWFLSEEGRQTMEHLLSWQSDHGDWPKNEDTTTKAYSGDRKKLHGTFDNGATTGELRALARAFTLTADARYEKAFLKGFDHILEAQYANGGWPQYFPLRKGYYTHITFNDNCMVRLLEFLRSATTAKEFSFLDANRRDKATKAIEQGIDCIVKCQVVIKGTPTVWCAQHDAVTLAPAMARSYELASLSGSESAGILNFLMSLPDPSPEVIRAVQAGVAWFESAKITGVKIEKVNGDRKVSKDESAQPVWARFYELETNRPFFCDRDGVPKYNLDEIGYERRNGYTWYGNWGDSLANTHAKWPHH